jgi:hypothetical protein
MGPRVQKPHMKQRPGPEPGRCSRFSCSAPCAALRTEGAGACLAAVSPSRRHGDRSPLRTRGVGFVPASQPVTNQRLSFSVTAQTRLVTSDVEAPRAGHRAGHRGSWAGRNNHNHAPTNMQVSGRSASSPTTVHARHASQHRAGHRPSRCQSDRVQPSGQSPGGSCDQRLGALRNSATLRKSCVKTGSLQTFWAGMGLASRSSSQENISRSSSNV